MNWRISFGRRMYIDCAATHAPDTNDTSSPYISLSWDYASKPQWPILKTIEIDGVFNGIATDKEHIYISRNTNDSLSNRVLELRKYTMDGNLVGTSRGFLATASLVMEITFTVGTPLY